MNNDDKIIDATPFLDRDIGLNYAQEMTPEGKVTYLVQNLRLTINNLKNLAKWTNSTCLDTKWTPFKKNDYDIEQDNFSGEGRAMTELLIRLHSEKQGMSFEKFDISSLAELCPKENVSLIENLQNNTHSFTIATIEGKRYIIDCAYRQFFQTENNEQSLDLNKTMSYDEKRRKLAEQILKYGWIEATSENVKMYLDGFIEATAGDKAVRLPTEQEYMNNMKEKVFNIVEKILYTYKISDLWQLYSKEQCPYISDELGNFTKNELRTFLLIKNKLMPNKVTFSIISKDGKKYIRTNRTNLIDEEFNEECEEADLEMVPEKEDLEFTKENLKIYLDGILKKVAENPEIVTPSIEEYSSLYPCDNPPEKSFQFISGINTTPYIDPNYNDNFNIEMPIEEQLRKIVQKERMHLGKSNNLETDSLRGECEDSTLRVLLDSASRGFEVIDCLYPQTYLKTFCAGHNCSVIKKDGHCYLVDCTYRQFFEKTHSELFGEHMTKDKSKKRVAEEILTNGWIELTKENLKIYVEGFLSGKRSISKEEQESLVKKFITPFDIAKAAEKTGIASVEIDKAKSVLEESMQNKQSKSH